VSQIERGVMQPSVSRLIAITDGSDVPLTSVFDPSGRRRRPRRRASGCAAPSTTRRSCWTTA
jgi:transcriptional regulator with XRE-family HTH domain